MASFKFYVLTMGNDAFLTGFHGVHPDDLKDLSDLQLADWQTNNKQPVHQILADREWQRRMISHQLTEQFNLDSRLAEATNRSMRFAAIIGVVGTLAGAAVGAFATFRTSGAQTSQQATQPPTQAQAEMPKVQSTPARAPAPASSK